MSGRAVEAFSQSEYRALCAALPERIFFQPCIPGLEEKKQLFGEERVVTGQVFEVGELPSYELVEVEVTEADLLLEALQGERVQNRTEVKNG